ncbi:hypothetical protein MRX96_031768 [Rhipicephalus microplus]
MSPSRGSLRHQHLSLQASYLPARIYQLAPQRQGCDPLLGRVHPHVGAHVDHLKLPCHNVIPGTDGDTVRRICTEPRDFLFQLPRSGLDLSAWITPVPGRYCGGVQD